MGLPSQRLQRSAGQCGGGDLGVRAPRSPRSHTCLQRVGDRLRREGEAQRLPLGAFRETQWLLEGALEGEFCGSCCVLLRREEGVDILSLLGMSP